PLDSYQASYVQDTYNRSNHMGHYYELAFRDLYPAPPNSDCHHTKKFQVDKEVYDETFSFDVIEFGTRMPCEFTCGSSNSKLIPILFPNDFVGINLYSKSAPHTETADMNLEEMLKVIEDIGLGWATEEESWAGLDTGFNIVPHAEDCVYV
ncbi:hypothetical protein TrRE_jg11551, partial [Triparma retinervis]